MSSSPALGDIDVLFVTQDSPYPQMGVLYLVDALRQRGFRAAAVACSVANEDFLAKIEALRPRVIGMSVMTAPEIEHFERLSVLMKAVHPGIPVVWGGVHPTLLTDVCAAALYIDHVFVGQGEGAFPDVVDRLVRGEVVPRIIRGNSAPDLDRYEPDWGSQDLAQFVFSERHSVRSPDMQVRTEISSSVAHLSEALAVPKVPSERLSSPTRQTIEQMRKWDVGLYETDRRLFYYLLTSRGCPYRCTFCSEPLQVMNGNEEGRFQWSAHGVDWVKRQVDRIRAELAEQGYDRDIDGIGIWDDMFWVGHPRTGRAREILQYLHSESLRYLIEARADQLMRRDGELMHELAATGCLQVFIGAESASQETLNLIRKGTRVANYFKLMKLADSAQVALRMSFIVGFPDESDASVNATLDLCESITAGEFGPWVNVSGPKIFTPYPGTVEFDRAVNCGFVRPIANSEWGGINRSTEAYLRHFPWFARNYTASTQERLAHLFGTGHSNVRAH